MVVRGKSEMNDIHSKERRKSNRQIFTQYFGKITSYFVFDREIHLPATMYSGVILLLLYFMNEYNV